MPIPAAQQRLGRSVNRLKSYSAARNARSASWSGSGIAVSLTEKAAIDALNALAQGRFPDRRSKQDDTSGNHPDPGRQHGERECLGQPERMRRLRRTPAHDRPIHARTTPAAMPSQHSHAGNRCELSTANEAAKTETPKGATITMLSQLAAASIPTMVD